MKLYIVRHAQSQRNAGHDSGDDAQLTEIGREQAARLGKYFIGRDLDKIYCSPLARARDTLKGMKPYVRSVPISYTPKIVEHDMGRFSKRGYDDWKAYFDAAARTGVQPHLFRPDGGESLQDAYHRADEFYRELLKKHPHDNVLINGHGIISLYMILNALGLDVTEGKYMQLSNASVSELDTNAKGIVKAYKINDFHHLLTGANDESQS